MKIKCKVQECSRPSVKDGFCGWCHKKYLKGIYSISGELSLKAQAEASRKNMLKQKKDKKEKQKEIAEKKNKIKGRLSTNLLKVLQQEDSNTDKPFYCNALGFFTSNSVCFARMFIFQRHNECLKCQLHDDKLDALNKFLDSKEGEKNGQE